MPVLYLIRSRTDATQTYIGIDTPASQGYYPRAYEHVQSAYKIGPRQNADQFISRIGAYNCDFAILTSKEFYGLHEKNFNEFSKYWAASDKEISKLMWAEVCWIYWYRTRVGLQNNEWGGRGTDVFRFQSEGFKKKLTAAGIQNTNFGKALIDHIDKKGVVWIPSQLDEQNLYKLLWPEEFVIKDWIKTSFANYLLDSDKIIKSIKESLQSLDGKTLEAGRINLTENVKDYFKNNLNPSLYKTEIDKLSKIVGYDINLTIDEKVIDEMAKTVSVILIIDRSTKEIRIGKTKAKQEIRSFFKTNLKQQRKPLPSWLEEGSINIKGTPINEEMKQLITQDAWKIIAQKLQPVESELDVISLAGDLPFINQLNTEEETNLNSMLQDLKREAVEGPIVAIKPEVFDTQAKMFDAVAQDDSLIPFRRREWKKGRVVVRKQTYEAIRKASPENLAAWKVW